MSAAIDSVLEELGKEFRNAGIRSENGEYQLFVPLRVCRNLMTGGTQKRPKRGFFKLERDMHKFFKAALPVSPPEGN